MRTFVYMRQFALSHKDLTEKIAGMESRYDKKFKDVFEAMNYLLNKDKMRDDLTQRKRIGYWDQDIPDRNYLYRMQYFSSKHKITSMLDFGF